MARFKIGQIVYATSLVKTDEEHGSNSTMRRMVDSKERMTISNIHNEQTHIYAGGWSWHADDLKPDVCKPCYEMKQDFEATLFDTNNLYI